MHVYACIYIYICNIHICICIYMFEKPWENRKWCLRGSREQTAWTFSPAAPGYTAILHPFTGFQTGSGQTFSLFIEVT